MITVYNYFIISFTSSNLLLLFIFSSSSSENVKGSIRLLEYLRGSALFILIRPELILEDLKDKEGVGLASVIGEKENFRELGGMARKA
jgi:hypothetical protein